ncbi:MAG: esterase-like activity of phytase family protein [Pseudomonadota bacterium]
MRTNLVALILGVTPVAAEPVRIDISAPHVVGVSGIEITDNGEGFIAVSDAGWFLEGTLTRKAGILSGGEVTKVRPIMGQNGFPVRARRVGDWSDAEGLALLPDGTIYVSFERWARVARYQNTTASGEWIKDHADFATFDDNRELEAVAVDAVGQVYAMPEVQTDPAGFQIYKLDSDGWVEAGHIPASDGFALVGVDFGPGGTLYILERKLVFATWWQSRVQRYDMATGGLEVLWQTDPNEMGNLEGISVWQGPDGLRATMVSDNNGTRGVPTEIVEIRLTQ